MTKNKEFTPIQNESNLWNFIDKNGNILSPRQWFKSVASFGQLPLS